MVGLVPPRGGVVRSLGADSVAVDVIDRDTADDPDLVADIESADLVYLSGGKPTLLHRILDGSAAWRAIEGVLARGGILAGCSAGAMVQGERIAGLRGASHATPGFGLLPGAIVLPHFDEYPSMIGAAVSRLVGRGLSVVGVDGGTALVRHQGQLRAVGRGSVTVWGPLGHHRFSDEDAPGGRHRADVTGTNFLIRQPASTETGVFCREQSQVSERATKQFQGERWAAHTSRGRRASRRADAGATLVEFALDPPGLRDVAARHVQRRHRTERQAATDARHPGGRPVPAQPSRFRVLGRHIRVRDTE